MEINDSVKSIISAKLMGLKGEKSSLTEVVNKGITLTIGELLPELNVEVLQDYQDALDYFWSKEFKQIRAWVWSTDWHEVYDVLEELLTNPYYENEIWLNIDVCFNEFAFDTEENREILDSIGWNEYAIKDGEGFCRAVSQSPSQIRAYADALVEADKQMELTAYKNAVEYFTAKVEGLEHLQTMVSVGSHIVKGSDDGIFSNPLSGNVEVVFWLIDATEIEDEWLNGLFEKCEKVWTPSQIRAYADKLVEADAVIKEKLTQRSKYLLTAKQKSLIKKLDDVFAECIQEGIFFSYEVCGYLNAYNNESGEMKVMASWDAEREGREKYKGERTALTWIDFNDDSNIITIPKKD